jgi:transposase-like protein
MDRASLEQLLGRGLSLAEIGRRFDLHEATVGYWLKKHGLQPANRAKHAPRGGIPRDELAALVDAGCRSPRLRGRSVAARRRFGIGSGRTN